MTFAGSRLLPLPWTGTWRPNSRPRLWCPEAEQELREAVRAAPAVAPYRAQLGSILGLQGKWKDALECFQKAFDLALENLDFRRETRGRTVAIWHDVFC